jgi:O-antigen/teichoic acid export membrane protein
MTEPLDDATPSSFARRIARISNTAMFLGLLGTTVRIGSNILLLPIALTYLSQPEMAVWWIFLSLGALSTLADFGFAPAITRVYSFLWGGADDFDTEGLRPVPEHGSPNLPRIHQLHVTVARLYLILATVVTLVLAIGGTLFLWPKMHHIENATFGWLAWALFVVVIGLNLKTSYWLTAAQGINRVREVQASNLWSGLVYLVVGSVLLFAEFKLVALALAVGARALVARWICVRAFSNAAEFDEGKPLSPDRTMLKRLWPNAKKFGIMSIGSYCITQGLILIGSQLLSLNILASLGLTQQIGIFVASIASLWLQVKWPEITILRTQGHSRAMSVLFAQRLALSIASFVAIGGIVVLFGNELLQWKGTQTRLLSFGPLTYYLAYLAFQMAYGAFGMLAMTENVIPFYRIAISTGIVTVLVSVIMTYQWHLWGLLLAPLICEAAYSAWFTIRRGFESQPLTVGEFLRAAVFARV